MADEQYHSDNTVTWAPAFSGHITWAHQTIQITVGVPVRASTFFKSIYDQLLLSEHTEPGTEIGAGMVAIKVKWTWEHVLANAKHDPALEVVEWRAAFSGPLIWNGLKIEVQYGRAVRAPRVFKDIHDEVLDALGEDPMRHFSTASEGPTLRLLAENSAYQAFTSDVDGLYIEPPNVETLRKGGVHEVRWWHRLTCRIRGHEWSDYASYVRRDGEYVKANVCTRCHGAAREDIG